jgi:hypothetical protein
VTNSERQARHKSRLVALGLVQVAVWVPVAAVADIQRAAELLRANPLLTVARLANVKTGRLVSLKR